jgi:lipopolysaccharide biosynthesis regulator YciM
MSDLPVLTWILVIAALVTGILAGHYGWGRRWPRAANKLHPDYLAGLDFLVTEQPDRALDMFLRLLDANADTVETHFALGSLYRRRGEVERAIRIHQNLRARTELPQEHREQALLALARDYLRAGVLDRAEALFQQVSEVPRLRASALDALRGVYELQHDWHQALGVLRSLEQIHAGPGRHIAAHYLCELAATAIANGDTAAARRLLREARAEAASAPAPQQAACQAVVPFPRAALLRADIARRAGDRDLAIRLLRTAINHSMLLLQAELPNLLALTGPEERDEILADLVQRASRDFEDLKKLAFAALAADLSALAALRPSIEKVLSQDDTLHAVWRAASGQYERIAQEIGALMALAEKYRCAECGFSARSFYWQCPACHAWDSFETSAVIRLR